MQVSSLSGTKRKLQGLDANEQLGQGSMTSDGRLLIDVDKEEEVDVRHIPMKHQLEKTIANGSAKNNLSSSIVKLILRVGRLVN